MSRPAPKPRKLTTCRNCGHAVEYDDGAKIAACAFCSNILVLGNAEPGVHVKLVEVKHG